MKDGYDVSKSCLSAIRTRTHHFGWRIMGRHYCADTWSQQVLCEATG